MLKWCFHHFLFVRRKTKLILQKYVPTNVKSEPRPLESCINTALHGTNPRLTQNPENVLKHQPRPPAVAENHCILTKVAFFYLTMFTVIIYYMEDQNCENDKINNVKYIKYLEFLLDTAIPIEYSLNVVLFPFIIFFLRVTFWSIYTYIFLYNLVRHTHTQILGVTSSFNQIYLYCLQTWRTRFRLDVTFISQKGIFFYFLLTIQMVRKTVHIFRSVTKTNYNSTEILQSKSTEVSTIVISKHSH